MFQCFNKNIKVRLTVNERTARSAACIQSEYVSQCTLLISKCRFQILTDTVTTLSLEKVTNYTKFVGNAAFPSFNLKIRSLSWYDYSERSVRRIMLLYYHCLDGNMYVARTYLTVNFLLLYGERLMKVIQQKHCNSLSRL